MTGCNRDPTGTSYRVFHTPVRLRMGLRSLFLDTNAATATLYDDAERVPGSFTDWYAVLLKAE